MTTGKYRYYILGYAVKPKDGFPCGYPYGVYYHPELDRTPFELGQGVGHCAESGLFSAYEIIAPKWQEHFRQANCTWLLPLLRRMARGEQVTSNDILEGYAQYHGGPPKIQEVEGERPEEVVPPTLKTSWELFLERERDQRKID